MSEAKEFVMYNGRMHRVRCSANAKQFENMSLLRKMVSWKYIEFKVRSWGRRRPRDTLLMDDLDDEERFSGLRRSDEMIRCEELMLGDNSECNADSPERLSHRRTSSTFTDLEVIDERSSQVSLDLCKEQRWCRNCCKNFNRQWSCYEDYCGLDCKTAHRIRLSCA